MGKKGSKRKTQWRTLSIAAPPGEEDEEDGLRNGYSKNQDREKNGTHAYERNGQSGYKPRRGIGSNSTGGTSGYSSGGSRSRRDEANGSPSQPKIIFNEDEYTRITTPRQDVLFKKGYLSRKKPWTSNASTSATPSTAESQSASHSTADGSETTEDQQLLDRDATSGDYPQVVEPGAQYSYSTFYDHSSGYYYEYPVMLVGPTPIPAQVGPGVMTAMPCAPVPLRPIEWVNPAFVPKLSAQPYCLVDYQTAQGTDGVPLVDEQTNATLPANDTNGTWNESSANNPSCNGSVTGETEEVTTAPTEEDPESTTVTEETTTVDESCPADAPYMDPSLMQPPVHLHHHVVPTVPQPYMYPGHYMFGSSLINVNGVTIQSGPMIRTVDAAAAVAVSAKRRKKKKKRKQRRTMLGNAEDEEEEEYSSECDNGLPSSRLPWTESTNASTTTTTTTTMATAASTHRPLNPECQEFRPSGRTRVSLTTGNSLSPINAISETNDESSDPTTNDAPTTTKSDPEQVSSTCEETSNGPNSELDNDTKRLNIDTVDATKINGDEKINEEVCQTWTNGYEDVDEVGQAITENVIVKTAENNLTNGEIDTDVQEATENMDARPKVEEIEQSKPCNSEQRESEAKTSSQNHNPKISNAQFRKKYAKSSKFVREPTPGPDLDVSADTADVVDNEAVDIATVIDNVSMGNESENRIGDERNNEDHAEDSFNDSGFESQTRASDYPITEAVTEWLRRANSPDVFITSARDSSHESDEDDEDDGRNVEVENENARRDNRNDKPPKNLQGNPVPALSVNSGVDDSKSSRSASCGEFAIVNNKTSDIDRSAGTKVTSAGSRRKRGGKKKRRDDKSARKTNSVDNARMKNSSISTCSHTADQLEESFDDRVGDVCEFTKDDSVAGMRVAISSRMTDSKRVRRTRKAAKSSREQPIESVNVKIRCVKSQHDDDKDEGIVIDTLSVRTFEQGAIVVLENGKMLPVSSYEPILRTDEDDTDNARDANASNDNTSFANNEDDDSTVASLASIEEPDVLECWEAETIEPVITPKRMIEARGTSYDGEATEDDVETVDASNIERVQKYYRLANNGSATSIEEDSTPMLSLEETRLVPNSLESMIDSYCSEEIPVITPTERLDRVVETDQDVPIDEAYEVYESCYTGKPPAFIDSRAFDGRKLYGRHAEGPISCKTVCCNVQ